MADLMKRDNQRNDPNSGELALHCHEFDKMVLQSPGIDPFCSSSAWALAAHASFMPDNPPVFFRLDSGFAALCSAYWPGWGVVLLPMEASWLLACPLVGPKPMDLARDLYARLRTGTLSWDAVFLAGMVENGALWQAVLKVFSRDYTIYRGPETSRSVARLRGGMDGFLGRRSAKFRANTRAIWRKIDSQMFTFEYLSSPIDSAKRERIFSVLMDIEARSWKGRSEQGVNTGSMRDFYDDLLKRLAASGRFRILIASIDGQPAGYIFGGVLHRLYRGFQFSYDARHKSLSLGNVLQLKMIEHLSDEGFECYDLGTEVAYKQRWAEALFKTRSLIIRRGSA